MGEDIARNMYTRLGINKKNYIVASCWSSFTIISRTLLPDVLKGNRKFPSKSVGGCDTCTVFCLEVLLKLRFFYRIAVMFIDFGSYFAWIYVCG